MATVADVKARLGFASVADDTVQTWLDVAERQVNATQWGARADDGIIFLTGHYLLTAAKGEGAAPGAVTSARVGDVSESYAVSDGAKQSVFGSTVWGREYLQLLRLVFPCRVRNL